VWLVMRGRNSPHKKRCPVGTGARRREIRVPEAAARLVSCKEVSNNVQFHFKSCQQDLKISKLLRRLTSTGGIPHVF